MADLFAQPLPVTSADECLFYHSLDLPQSGSHSGQWDLRGRFTDYIGGTDLRGKTVLDVGTASGFLTFEAEKSGAAQVVSVDAASARYWQELPFVNRDWYRNHDKWVADNEPVLQSMQRSYWLAHREFGSKARVYYGNIYDLPEELGQFDVAIIGQILVHLSDTITALTSVARRTRHTLIVAERILTDLPPRSPLQKLLSLMPGMQNRWTGSIASDIAVPNARKPQSFLIARRDNPDRPHSFWHHTYGFYVEVLGMLGFELVKSVYDKSYICNLPTPHDEQITSLIFQRR